MGVSKFNSEGYPDPTAYQALKSIEGRFPFRPVVYICSPLSGDVERNQEFARKYCCFAVEQGVIPLAPHIYFPQFMDDDNSDERSLAIFMDLVLLSKCVELWVFGETISEGMKAEIEKANRRGMPVRHFTIGCEEVDA